MRYALWVCVLSGLLTLMPSWSQAAPSATLALSRELEQVKLDAIPLGEVVTLLTDATGANFHINWKALQAAGVDRTTAVTLHLRHVTVRKTLSLVIEQLPATAPLSFFNDQGVIELTTLELADLAVVTKVYNVEDLLIVAPELDPAVGLFDSNTQSSNGSSSSRSSGYGSNSNSNSNSRSTRQSSQRTSSSSSSSRSGGRGSGGTSSSGSGNASGTNTDTETREGRLTGIVELIRDTVEPTIWKENGGTASISSFNGHLIITAPRRVHERIGGAIE